MHTKNVWTEENPDPNAYWPRYRGYQATVAAGTTSTPNDRFLQNASYLRVKNITVDYSLPQSLISRI